MRELFGIEPRVALSQCFVGGPVLSGLASRANEFAGGVLGPSLNCRITGNYPIWSKPGMSDAMAQCPGI